MSHGQSALSTWLFVPVSGSNCSATRSNHAVEGSLQYLNHESLSASRITRSDETPHCHRGSLVAHRSLLSYNHCSCLTPPAMHASARCVKLRFLSFAIRLSKPPSRKDSSGTFITSVESCGSARIFTICIRTPAF